MIICISANPALDQRVWLNSLNVGAINRAQNARSMLGGKAAHVAMAARELGEAVLWVGFLGGVTGTYLEHKLTALRIPAEIVRSQSATRINQEIIEVNGTVTEILEPGGTINEDEAIEMFSVCCRLFDRHTGAKVVLSGSLPPGLPATFYAKLIEAAHDRGCAVFLDASGEALIAGIAMSPDLVKPNRHEAEGLLGRSVRDQIGAVAAARLVLDLGARSVALSLGSEGLVWIASPDTEPLILRPPVISGRSAVGCGDTVLAGLAVSSVRQMSPRDGAVLAVACGVANCLAESPGMIDTNEVRRLTEQIVVEEWVER